MQLVGNWEVSEGQVASSIPLDWAKYYFLPEAYAYELCKQQSLASRTNFRNTVSDSISNSLSTLGWRQQDGFGEHRCSVQTPFHSLQMIHCLIWSFSPDQKEQCDFAYIFHNSEFT